MSNSFKKGDKVKLSDLGTLDGICRIYTDIKKKIEKEGFDFAGRVLSADGGEERNILVEFNVRHSSFHDGSLSTRGGAKNRCYWVARKEVERVRVNTVGW